MGSVTIGVDIGQKHDPTSVCVIETDERPRAGSRDTETHHVARFLQRFPLNTPYPSVARRLAEIVEGAEARTGASGERSTPPVWLDATGVGKPVVDLLWEAHVQVIAVYFTHGDRLTRDRRAGTVSMGKALLVSKLQVLLQSGTLHLPRSDEARVLARELIDYEIRIDEKANDTYGAFRVGTHDDLVSALGLAVLAAQYDGPVGVWFP